MTEAIVCAFCGRTATSEGEALTWTSSFENGRLRRFCETCSRQNLRSIEGKLDSDWW